jgi:hypothetical protein
VRARDGIELADSDDALLTAPPPGPPPSPTGALPGEEEEAPEEDATAAPDAAAGETAETASDGPPPPNVLLLYSRSTLQKVHALNAALRESETALAKWGGTAKGPGSRGGHFWIDAKGQVRYGTPPASSSADKKKAAADKKAAHAALVAQHKADAAAKKKAKAEAAAAKKATAAAAKAAKLQMKQARLGAKAELAGLHDLQDMGAAGWKILTEDGFGEGPDGKAAANNAAQAAGGKDPKNLYAVVKVNGSYYVVSKPVTTLAEQGKGLGQSNVVGGGSHKTSAADAKAELGAGSSPAGGSGPAPKTGGIPKKAPIGTGTPHPTAKADLPGELRKWQTKAVRRVQDGRPATCPFQSDAIPAATAAAIADALDFARDPAGVRAVFAPYLATAAPTQE